MQRSPFINTRWRELSNLDIDRIGVTLPQYGGCYAQEELGTVDVRGRWIVVNYGNQHWVCLYDCHPQYCLYMDSFGVKPSSLVVECMARTGKSNLYWNQHELQSLQSELCGFFCLQLVSELLAGRSLTTICLEDYWPENAVLGVEFNDVCLTQYCVEKGWATLLRLPH